MEFTWFTHRTIAVKLFLGFVTLLALNTILGLFCLHQLSVVYNSERDLAQRQVPSLLALADLRFSVNLHRHAQFEYLVARTDAQRQECDAHLREAAAAIQSAQERYGSRISDREEQRIFQEIKDALAQYLMVSKQAMDLARVPHHRSRTKRRSKLERLQADLLFGPEKDALGKTVSALQSTVALNLRLAETANQSSTELYGVTRRLVKAGIVLSIVIGLLLALLIGSMIVRPIHRVLAAARRITAGDLTETLVTSTSHEEADELAHHLNQMQAALWEMIEAVADGAERVVSASEPISAATRQQAEGASAQQQQAQQLATVMQQMTVTAKDISDRSCRAAETARQAVETAGKGGATLEAMLTQIKAIANSVAQTSRQMQEMGASSEQISRVISVIDDIAGQTNLLALNAAIEAARAGEHGRGFAIVAAEVTKLAERTTRATKEIAVTIGKTQTETRSAMASMSEGITLTENGMETARQVSLILRNVITASQELGGMLTQIANAATRQTTAYAYASSGLEQISKITDESAESAQRSADAVAELSGLTTDLQKLVSRFRSKREVSNGEPEQSRAGWRWKTKADVERVERDRTTSGLALAVRNVSRPGVAKIHARLLTPETDSESQPRVPSASSAGRPA